MNRNEQNTGDSNKCGHSHAKHMWMMAVCCGLPILGFIAIGALGVTMPSLKTVLLLICPLGMIAMMYMMSRDKRKESSSRSFSEESRSELPAIQTTSRGNSMENIAKVD